MLFASDEEESGVQKTPRLEMLSKYFGSLFKPNNNSGDATKLPSTGANIFSHRDLVQVKFTCSINMEMDALNSYDKEEDDEVAAILHASINDILSEASTEASITTTTPTLLSSESVDKTAFDVTVSREFPCDSSSGCGEASSTAQDFYTNVSSLLEANTKNGNMDIQIIQNAILHGSTFLQGTSSYASSSSCSNMNIIGPAL